MTERRKHRYITATLAVLAAVGADRLWLRPSTAVAEPYHARMKEAAEALPSSFGDWIGLDVPVPAAAIRLLRPNVIVSRRYQNMRTGESVSFLLVQVSDARDIIGHFPPVCYPSQGWVAGRSEQQLWQAGSAVEGMEYQFSRESIAGTAEVVVANYLFLPGGRTCRRMSDIESAAQSRAQKLFGAGQVQVVFDPSVGAERRREIVNEFVAMAGHVTTLPATGE